MSLNVRGLLPSAAPARCSVGCADAASRRRACRCRGPGRPRRPRPSRRPTKRGGREGGRKGRAAAVRLPAGPDRGDRDRADACRRSPARAPAAATIIVRLEAVVLPDKSRVPLKPAATLRCPMATAVAEWVRGDVAAIASEARHLGQRTRQLRFVRLPRPQPRRRRAHVRARPRQCARRARRQVRERPVRVVHRSRRSRANCARNSSLRCARASPPCLVRAPTGTTRTTSISISPSGAGAIASASGTSGIRCRRSRRCCRQRGRSDAPPRETRGGEGQA